MRLSRLGVVFRVWLVAVAILSLALVQQARAQQSDPPATLLGVVLEFMVEHDYESAKGAFVERLEFRPDFSDLVILQFKEKSAEFGAPRSYWVDRRKARPYDPSPLGFVHNVRAIMEYEGGMMWETLFQFHFRDHRWRLGSFRLLDQWREETSGPE